MFTKHVATCITAIKHVNNFYLEQVDELPTLLAKAGATVKLRKTITDMEVFRRLTQTEEGKFDLIKFWNQVIRI